MSVLILLLNVAFVATTALVLSSRVTGGSPTRWLVGAYVIGFAEIVLVSLLLSTAAALTRPILVASLATVFGIVVASCRPVRFPPFGASLKAVLQELRDPPVAVVAAVVVVIVAYSIALGLFLPPNDQDALEYHLARAAFWRQQEAIGYIPGATDARLNGLPLNAEIGVLFTMITSGTGRFAPLVQLTAGIATAVAVYGISRQIGLSRRAALFGGLLLLTLPVIALQLSTGLNDVVVASFVAATALFLLGTTRGDLALTGISAALMVGTKLTGLLALPGVALIAVTGRVRGRFLALTVLGLATVAGAYWYWINLLKVGDPLGASAAGDAGISSEGVNTDPVGAVARVLRLALASIELPGAIGLDHLLYVAAAGLLVAVAYASPGTLRERTSRGALAAGATLTPLVLIPFGHLLLRGTEKIFFELGRPDVGYLDSARSSTKASPIFSWYGPLGVLLTLLSFGLVIRAVRRQQMPSVALAIAAAPAIWIVLVGVTVPYWEWNGRYAMGGFVLGTAIWGSVLSFRPIAWSAAAVAGLTATLAFVHLHDRSSGLRLLEPTVERSVWTQPDWAIQGTDHPDQRALLRFAQQHIPKDARIALAPNIWPGRTTRSGPTVYPFFTPALSRTVVFADSVEEAEGLRAEWAVLRKQSISQCARGWERTFAYEKWIVVRRTPGSRCR